MPIPQQPTQAVRPSSAASPLRNSAQGKSPERTHKINLASSLDSSKRPLGSPGVASDGSVASPRQQSSLHPRKADSASNSPRSPQSQPLSVLKHQETNVKRPLTAPKELVSSTTPAVTHAPVPASPPKPTPATSTPTNLEGKKEGTVSNAEVIKKLLLKLKEDNAVLKQNQQVLRKKFHDLKKKTIHEHKLRKLYEGERDTLRCPFFVCH